MKIKEPSKQELVIKDLEYQKRSSANLGIDKKYGEIMLSHVDNPEEIIQNILLYISRYRLTSSVNII